MSMTVCWRSRRGPLCQRSSGWRCGMDPLFRPGAREKNRRIKSIARGHPIAVGVDCGPRRHPILRRGEDGSRPAISEVAAFRRRSLKERIVQREFVRVGDARRRPVCSNSPTLAGHRHMSESIVVVEEDQRRQSSASQSPWVGWQAVNVISRPLRQERRRHPKSLRD